MNLGKRGDRERINLVIISGHVTRNGGQKPTDDGKGREVECVAQRDGRSVGWSMLPFV